MDSEKNIPDFLSDLPEKKPDFPKINLAQVLSRIPEKELQKEIENIMIFIINKLMLLDQRVKLDLSELNYLNELVEAVKDRLPQLPKPIDELNNFLEKTDKYVSWFVKKQIIAEKQNRNPWKK